MSLALTGLLLVLTLTRSPPRVVSVSARGEDTLGSLAGDASVCQAGETLPGGVSAVRVQLAAEFGPPVLIRAYSGGRVVTEGRRTAGWTATSVTVPVRPLQRAVAGVRLCFVARPNSERMQLYGVHTAAAEAAMEGGGQPLAGRMTVEYLASGHGSWLSRALTVARHVGIGRAIGGTWVALLILMLVAAVAGLTVRVAWRELP